MLDIKVTSRYYIEADSRSESLKVSRDTKWFLPRTRRDETPDRSVHNLVRWPRKSRSTKVIDKKNECGVLWKLNNAIVKSCTHDLKPDDGITSSEVINIQSLCGTIQELFSDWLMVPMPNIPRNESFMTKLIGDVVAAKLWNSFIKR